jgi:subtilisin family serine protease
VVVAAGNSGSKTGVSDPACVPGVISVGAVYDNDYGGRSWNLSGGGTCTDSPTNADRVTCFSQSASFLSLLAPGTFVAAPDGTLVKSGTSQATPHVAGAVAILRARYPNESLSSTLQRLQLSGTSVTDSATAANARVTPRLNVAAAVQLGTNLILTGSGDSVAVNGGTSSYLLTVSNSGPLIASNLKMVLQMPTGASLQSSSSGCVLSGSTVTCSASTLAVNASQTFTVMLRWSIDGPVAVSAAVSADQTNSAPAAQQQLSFADTAGSGNGDAPLPLWAWCLLAGALLWLSQRQVRTQEQQ